MSSGGDDDDDQNPVEAGGDDEKDVGGYAAVPDPKPDATDTENLKHDHGDDRHEAATSRIDYGDGAVVLDEEERKFQAQYQRNRERLIKQRRKKLDELLEYIEDPDLRRKINAEHNRSLEKALKADEDGWLPAVGHSDKSFVKPEGKSSGLVSPKAAAFEVVRKRSRKVKRTPIPSLVWSEQPTTKITKNHPVSGRILKSAVENHEKSGIASKANRCGQNFHVRLPTGLYETIGKISKLTGGSLSSTAKRLLGLVIDNIDYFANHFANDAEEGLPMHMRDLIIKEMPDDLHADLSRIAEAEDRSKAVVARRMIAQAIRDLRERGRLPEGI